MQKQHSMHDKLKILVLDDDKLYGKLATTILKQDFTVYTALRPSLALDILAAENIDILICDFRLPEMNGLEVIKKVKVDYPSIEVIMISSDADMETVIEAFRIGAVDFFQKPFDFESVKISIERTKKFVYLNKKIAEIERSNSMLNQELKEKEGFELVSCSPVMDEIKQIMYKVAQSDDTSVIITGESGVGKELVARGIHHMSQRKENYFGAVNMSAIPESLFESEFFGHKKGSFTGAIGDKGGWFEIANQGTLFLDEVGDMPYNQQIKLLRVLEDRKFIKVGSQKEQEFDIRIVAATNKDVNMLKSGSAEFRLDLFHRLGTFEIYVPPLRERQEDIPVLLNYFAAKFAGKMRKRIAGIDPTSLAELVAYPFPGNVRELRNLVERAVILCDGDTLNLDHFPNILTAETPATNINNGIFDLEIVERNTIISALKEVNYNKTKAAKLLNINWNALHRRLQKLQIAIPEV
jgi:DNA-binding NtrC family response regulator